MTDLAIALGYSLTACAHRELVLKHLETDGHKIHFPHLLKEFKNYLPTFPKFNSDEYWDWRCEQAKRELHRKIETMRYGYSLGVVSLEISDELKHFLEINDYYHKTVSTMLGIPMQVPQRNKFINLPQTP